MEKNGAAGAREWRIGIVTDLDQPPIREIAVPHFLFLEPGRWILRVDDNMLVVLRMMRIIDPRVARSDRAEWIIRARGQRRIVRVNFADAENPRRRASVAFRFMGPGLIGP